MATEKNDDLIVTAGYATVLTKVGAGMAYVDVPQGAALPADVSDEDRNRLIASGAVRRRDGKPFDKSSDEVDAAKAARPVPGEVEPNEIDKDVLPGGSEDEVMAWIGDDLARARVARHEERAKGDKARAGLVEKLEQKMAELETEPPAVPEYYSEPSVDVAPGGVAVPVDDPGEGGGKPAKATKSTRSTSK